jgi:hypothetical protein
MAHFDFENHGSIWRLWPLTGAAHVWVEQHLPEDRVEFPDGVVIIEHRFVHAIAEGIAADGLTFTITRGN